VQNDESKEIVPLQTLHRVAWVGEDGGWKIGDTIDYFYHGRFLVREISSGKFFLISYKLLNDYPSEPIPEPTK